MGDVMTIPIPPKALIHQWIRECPLHADWRPFTSEPVRVGTDLHALARKAAAWGAQQEAAEDMEIFQRFMTPPSP